MEDDDYFPYENGEYEGEEKEQDDSLWGTYAVVYPIMESPPVGMNYEKVFFTSVIYTAALFYQKELAIGMGAWTKKPLWDAQEPYINALHEFWLSGMDDYLSEIREEKERNAVRKGIPRADRTHLRERNDL